MYKKYSVIPGLLQLKSNSDYIHYFAYGENLKNAVSAKNDDQVFEVKYSLKKKLNLPDGSSKCSNLFKDSKSNKVYYKKKILFNKSAELKIEKNNKSISITANKFYSDWIRLRFENLLPPGYHLSDFVNSLLLSSGYATLHCAALSLDGKGVLIFAPSGVGKSSTILKSRNFGSEIFSEDVAVTNGKYVFGCPHTNSYLNHSKDKLHSRIPFLSYFSKKGVSQTKQKKSNKLKVDYIFILEKGSPYHSKINSKLCYHFIRTINNMRFSFQSNNLVLLQNLLNKTFDVEDSMRLEKKTIYSLIKRSKQAYAIHGQNANQFFKRIKKVLQEEK